MTGVAPKFTGQVYPCCEYAGEDLPRESILEAWNSDRIKRMRSSLARNIWPPECKICQDTENRGNVSLRQMYNQWRKFEVKMRPDGFIANLPMFLSLLISKHCNFKCRMCGQISNHLLDAETIEIGSCQTPLESAFLLKNTIVVNELLYIIAQNPITHLEISGGEPLIDQYFYRYLDLLLEKGLSNKVNIQVSTNGSTLTFHRYDITNYLPKFNRFYLTVSVDGFGKYSEYGRTNFRWPSVSKILKKLSNLSQQINSFDLNVHAILNVYSLPGMFDLIKFCDQNDIAVHINEVNQLHYNIGILPTDYLIEQREKISANTFLTESNRVAHNELLNFIDNAFDFSNKKYWQNKFFEENQIKDYNRRTRFADIYRDLYEWYAPNPDIKS